MISDAEKTRLKKLFSDTIALLCRNGLPGACPHRVDALIGVTLDNQEVILVNFSEDFCQENASTTGKEITDERNSDKQSIRMPEKTNTSVTCSYVVKDEYTSSTSQDQYNTSVLGQDESYGADITVPNEHENAHNLIQLYQHMEPQGTESTNEDGSQIDRHLPESETTSALESDSDCLIIKTELREDGTVQKNMHSESANFIAPSACEIALPSVSARSSSIGASSLRVKHVHSMQRCPWWSPFRSKHYRPQQRYNTVGHSAANASQVSSFTDHSVLPLDGGADGLAPAADGDKGTASGREPVQCYVCGSWLRGRQTLNEHIRGLHLSIYNYHCKYCGLSFKWRSALRNHQLNCSVLQNQQ